MIKKLFLLVLITQFSCFIAFPQEAKLAVEYFNAGKYENAAIEFEKVLPEIEKKYGESDTSYYSLMLIYTAVSYDRTQQFKIAENYYYKAKAIYERINANNCLSYSLILNNLAELYRTTGNFEKAEPLYQQAIEMWKKSLGDEHIIYATSLNNLALLYVAMGYYDKAEQIYLQSLQIYKNSLGEEHPAYVNNLNNIALLYVQKGSYEKAEAIYLLVLQLKKNNMGEEHPDYIASLNNLAGLYFSIGNYDKAELLLLQTLQLSKKILGENHPDYAIYLNNLAGFYEEIGNYDKAVTFYLQALQIKKTVFGENNVTYATSLNNLSTLCASTGNYKEALPLNVQSLKIIKNILGKEHPDYAKALNNLAGLYRAIGNFEKARSLYLQALHTQKKIFGNMHPDYALTLNNLALLYKSINKFKKAESLFIHSMQIRKKVLGEEHPHYISSLNSLAGLYRIIGDFTGAENFFLQALYISSKQLELQSSFLTEIEMETYLQTVMINFNIFQSFILQNKIFNLTTNGENYNIELSTKSTLLYSGMQMRQRVINSEDSVINKIYNQWMSIRASLAKQYTLPIEKRTIDTKMMEEEANDLEKKLVRSSQVYAQGQQPLKTKWNDIKEKLSINEAAIEFASFDFYDGKRWTDSTYYVALVLRKNDRYPQMIYLFEEKQLDSILNQTSGNDFQKTTQLYANRGIIINGNVQSRDLSSKLYELIWMPIEPILKDVSSVYFSPSGLLHKISFAAISTTDSMCLADKYKLIQLGSTADIIRLKKQDDFISFSDTAFVFGGINYEKMKISESDTNSDEIIAYNRGPQISNNGSRSISWDYLPGTYNEARYIDSLFRKNKVTAAFYYDSNATESLFKSLSGKAPQIIHISTHGFFFPETNEKKINDPFNKFGEETYRFSENPLLRSGLILAGANYVWKGGAQTLGIDDGILTAYEVSNMNLYGTRLVVLSACETGLGDIKGSEGVFGLQRAFKMAGVNNIIMSLWQVPDKETTEFMQLFYGNCLSKHSIRESFYLAQESMRKKYDPYYWAAFILIE